MSFGIIHRDVNWEWEESVWTYVYFFIELEVLAQSQKSYTTAKIFERMRRHFNWNVLLLWSILEHMSNGACGARLTERIALLVCFIVFFPLDLVFYCRVNDDNNLP